MWRLLLLLILLFSGVTSSSAIVSEYRPLIDDLLSPSYNADIRPVIKKDTVINIGVAFKLVGIVSFNEIAQSLETTGWFDITWRDEFLSWNKSDYSNISKIVLPHTRIWTPDMTLINFHKHMESITPDFVGLEVYHDGTIFWHPGNLYETTCRLDITYFPFDTQTCDVIVGSWSHATDEITMYTLLDNIDVDGFQPNGEWELTSSEMTEYTSNVDEHEAFSRIKIKLTLTRRPTFFVFSTLLPVILMSVLNIVVFKVPVECGERLSYSITVVLAFAVFLSVITNAMPRNGLVVSLLATYLGIMIIFSSFVVIMTGVSINVYHRQGQPMDENAFLVKLYRSCTCCLDKPSGDQKNNAIVDSSSIDSRRASGASEWKEISRHLDSVLFWISLLVMVIITVAFLIMMAT